MCLNLKTNFHLGPHDLISWRVNSRSTNVVDQKQMSPPQGREMLSRWGPDHDWRRWHCWCCWCEQSTQYFTTATIPSFLGIVINKEICKIYHDKLVSLAVYILLDKLWKIGFFATIDNCSGNIGVWNISIREPFQTSVKLEIILKAR